VRAHGVPIHSSRTAGLVLVLAFFISQAEDVTGLGSFVEEKQ
jgi:hypothetical protein